MKRIFVPHFLLVAVVMLVVILYGSLYPFEFRYPAEPRGPLGVLLGSWMVPPSSFGDLVANVLLYVPLGFFGILALRQELGNRRRLVLVSLLGFVVCVSVEILQFYDAGRITNMSDLYLNTFGTLLGAIAGAAIGTERKFPLVRDLKARPIPSLVILSWLGYRLYPYVPTIDLHKYWNAVKPLIFLKQVSFGDILRYGVVWLMICYGLDAIFGPRRSILFFPIFAGLFFAAKLLIMTKLLTPEEIGGAGLGFAFWLAFLVGLSGRDRARVIALCFGVVVLDQRLAPFSFSMIPHEFGWIPFLGFMRGSLDVNIQAFLEKFFLYGGLIWLVTEAGMRLSRSAMLVAALLFTTSLVETHLPGRSAEITDAVMACIIAGVFAVMEAAMRPAKGVPRGQP
jgi:VanZ family protein